MTERRASLADRLAIAATAMIALLCFSVAALLSSQPRLSPTPPPQAEEVRRARNTAVELALALAADGTPRPVRFAERDLTAAAALANHGFGWLRIRPVVGSDELRLLADFRLAGATWLNMELRAVPADRFPDVWLRAGAWRVPPVMIRGAIRLADSWAAHRRYELPPVASMVRGFQVHDRAVSATLAVPRQLFSVAREVLGTTRPPVDPALVRLAYGRLLAAQLTRPDRTIAGQLRRLFSQRPQGADAVEYNRAALVALAMFAVSPDARQLAGGDSFLRAENEIEPPVLWLGGREDLAKHFALSAAMGASIEPRFTRAIGEWKELDDSLPGGTGFSFVDLTADRAGLHLGRAAVDPATAPSVAEQLATVGDRALFPRMARTLDEGMSDAEFRRRYGGLQAMTYAQAIRRVDRLLMTLPLYAPFLSAS